MITSSDVFATIPVEKLTEKLGQDKVGDAINRIYCRSSWDLGLTVGKPAYRKYIKVNGRKGVPTRRGLVPTNFTTHVELAKVVLEHSNRELKPTTSTSESTKLRHGSISAACSALPTVVIKASKANAQHPEKAFYKDVAKKVKDGMTLSAALMNTLTPEAKSLMGAMVAGGIIGADDVPGVRVSIR
jgi:hypothetical protein